MNDGVRRRRRVQIDIAVGDVGTQYARQGTDLLARSGIDLFKPGESFPFGFGMMLENEIEEADCLSSLTAFTGPDARSSHIVTRLNEMTTKTIGVNRQISSYPNCFPAK